MSNTDALRREATDAIEGRARFERDQLGGRKSTKPLRPVVLDPYQLIALLDQLDALAGSVARVEEWALALQPDDFVRVRYIRDALNPDPPT